MKNNHNDANQEQTSARNNRKATNRKTSFVVVGLIVVVMIATFSISVADTRTPQNAYALKRQYQGKGGLGCEDYDLGLSYSGCCKGNSLCGG
jgi:hypothetical protein